MFNLQEVTAKNQLIISPDVFSADMNQGENLSSSQELCLSQMMSSKNSLKKGTCQRKWFLERNESERGFDSLQYSQLASGYTHWESYLPTDVWMDNCQVLSHCQNHNERKRKSHLKSTHYKTWNLGKTLVSSLHFPPVIGILAIFSEPYRLAHLSKSR